MSHPVDELMAAIETMSFEEVDEVQKALFARTRALLKEQITETVGADNIVANILLEKLDEAALKYDKGE